MTYLRSLLRLRHTLKAISPMAMTKAATAATDNPAICAGVILAGASSDVAAATEVGVIEAVAAGRVATESAKADCVELDRDRDTELVTDVVVVAGF